MKLNKLMTTITVAVFGAFSLTSYAKAAGDTVSPAEKKQIENIIHDYVIKNPEVLVQSLQSFQEKQMDQARKAVQTNSVKFANALFHEGKDPVVGNANGKVTIVEFFDYQCSHCVDMAPVLEDLVKSNANIKLVFKEFPIRGAVSEYAAKVALAAKEQNKYVEFHKALMQLAAKQPLNQDAVLGVAKSVGLDINKMNVAIDSENIKQQIKATYKLAQALPLMGTPAFFIAKSDVSSSSPLTAITFVPGEIDKAQLAQLVNKLSQ